MKQKQFTALLLAAMLALSGCGGGGNSGGGSSNSGNSKQEENTPVYLAVRETYSQNGQKGSEIEYQYYDNGIRYSAEDSYDRSAEFSFDERGNLIKQTSDGAERNYTINQDGSIAEEVIEQEMLKDVMRITNTYTYYKDGSLKEMVYELDWDDSVDSTRSEYKYTTKKGKIVQCLITDTYDDGETAKRSGEYSYAEGTDLLESISYYYEDGELYHEITFEYNAYQNLIRKTDIHSIGTDYETKLVYEYEYKLFENAIADDLPGSTKAMLRSYIGNG